MITPRRIVISVLLAGCLVLLVWGFGLSRSSTGAVTYTDSAVKALEPQPGVLALRQERIGVTLGSDSSLAEQNADGLSIDGVGIPQDQIEFVPGLNQYFYTPGPGKEISALAPGRNCASILIKRTTDPNDRGHPFSWCWNSH